MKPTQEQESIITAAKQSHDLKVIAYAGAGKTSTLNLVAQALQIQGKQGLYLAFNKRNAEEAKLKMPRNVDCRTFHSLAFKATNAYKRWPNRVGQPYSASMLVDAYNIAPIGDITANTIGQATLAVLDNFCASMDTTINHSHIPDFYLEPQELAEKAMILANRVWNEHVLSNRGILPITHSMYAKVWFLSNPKISADFILFDEAQDADPMMIDIVSKQASQKIWVGDPYQQIYDWRGAKNALASVDGKELYLSKSFRFGKGIAEYANILLESLGEKTPIQGTDSIKSEVKTSITDPDAIVCRSNSQVLEQIMYMRIGDRKLYCPDVKTIISNIKDLGSIRSGYRASGQLSKLRSWDEVESYVRTSSGSSLQVYINMIENYGVQILLDCLNNVSGKMEESGNGLTICTMHKAKGLEWDKVRIVTNYGLTPETYPHAEDLDPEVLEECIAAEKRLMYVACTRPHEVLERVPEVDMLKV
jgi:superfamily I DNA/RNA helicase